ncbi:MAG TPA: sigma 54-interacting transcriptional regulator [Kofleriaceae bacterium]|nr:sigma 54-interacting transcriptional regulator [Kofleriaceae bacterium]
MTGQGAAAGTELLRSRHRDRIEVRRFRLVVTAGPDAGKVFESRGEQAVVGSHETADLRLEDRAVSRFHCEVALEDDAVRLRDLGSLNGTRLGGVAIRDAYLVSGASFALGRSEVLFELSDGRVDVPLSREERFGRLVGVSPAMRALFEVLERAAPSDATVLLEGESGTGKELAVESIHLRSGRSGGPLVVVDCGALAPTLLESELFGYARGSFTGARDDRGGAVESAAGGTLFLDEIGELPVDLQPKLLRLLERHEVKRIGETVYRKVDVRVVAATNRNLKTLVNERRFRSDLYYRLAVVKVVVPPLRDRLEDLPLLVEDLLRDIGAADQAEARAMREPEYLAELARHGWPGNIRELRHYLEHSLLLSRPPPPAEVSPAVDGGGDARPPGIPVEDGLPFSKARELALAAFERRYLEATLARHDGNVTASARASGVDRAHFYRLLRRHGLR